MKKRRTLIIALLLVAALALGVGYAAFTSVMNINGEVQMGGIASQVNFSKAEVNSASTATAVTANFDGVGSKSLEFNLEGFVHANHYVLVDLEIENPHDFDVTLIDYTFTQDGKKNDDGVQYFTIEVLNDALDNDPVIEKNDKLAFQVKVTCNATSPVDVTENFEIQFSAHAE
jgi:predicted ribosomally synthesized peptide with SipW-like signal peptide